ncbi:DUF4269 domain-containing protein [Sneathiella limimaris]|uniref:DUF4269 domain-containing protein n=1 Tax=Sneathiella limimaris TaxID=1964213 RepID=UPI001469A6CA|nr:DUF4269 domain-containing protein [Sneathiella limimaris]
MSHSLLIHEPLRSGTARQQAAFAALQALQIFERLKPYTPVLAGTIPLDVDIADSDLDIICASEDLDGFVAQVASIYGNHRGYSAVRRRVEGRESLIIRFWAEGFEFEIFAQDRPVLEQSAVVHLLIEQRLLNLGGPAARERIRTLKSEGLKTEPAFAQAFAIPGDPYQTLYELQSMSDAELSARFGGGF